MRDKIWQTQAFEQLPERIVEEVKVFEYGKFQDGQADGQRGFPEFCAEKADGGLPKQQKDEAPVERGIEAVAGGEQEPDSAFFRQKSICQCADRQENKIVYFSEQHAGRHERSRS